MKSKQLLDSLENINDSYISEALEKRPAGKSVKFKILAAAACFTLIFCAGIFFSTGQNGNNMLSKLTKTIQLSEASDGVKVKYSNRGANTKSSYDLVWLSEEELFSEFNTVIFKGTITKLDNISIDFNGEKEYNAIAQIKVLTVLRGNIKAGDTINVLLPCSIGDGIWVEDTDVVSAFKVGMTGIFMPVIYDEYSYMEMNGARLAMKDIADFGFADGVRYAFIETDSGPVFARYAYPTIENASSLDEIEQYVKSMINKG